MLRYRYQFVVLMEYQRSNRVELKSSEPEEEEEEAALPWYICRRSDSLGTLLEKNLPKKPTTFSIAMKGFERLVTVLPVRIIKDVLF